MTLQIARPVVLVVEEDDPTRTFIADNLTADGMAVVATPTAEEAIELAQRHMPDVAIVAVNGGSGRDFARLVRSGGCRVDRRLPTVLLGGDSHEIDELRALDAGADNYVAKPFSYPVLMARVTALLRRVELDASTPASPVRTCGDLIVDGPARRCTLAGQRIYFSNKEFLLLWTLMGDPERVWTKTELLRAILVKNGSGSTRTLDSHACRLRHKLGGEWVVNVHGVGYRLTDVAAVAA